MVDAGGVDCRPQLVKCRVLDPILECATSPDFKTSEPALSLLTMLTRKDAVAAAMLAGEAAGGAAGATARDSYDSHQYAAAFSRQVMSQLPHWQQLPDYSLAPLLATVANVTGAAVAGLRGDGAALPGCDACASPACCQAMLDGLMRHRGTLVEILQAFSSTATADVEVHTNGGSVVLTTTGGGVSATTSMVVSSLLEIFHTLSEDQASAEAILFASSDAEPAAGVEAGPKRTPIADQIVLLLDTLDFLSASEVPELSILAANTLHNLSDASLVAKGEGRMGQQNLRAAARIVALEQACELEEIPTHLPYRPMVMFTSAISSLWIGAAWGGLRTAVASTAAFGSPQPVAALSGRPLWRSIGRSALVTGCVVALLDVWSR